nr:EOG090X0O5J [Eurycercus lamellatus]
MAFGAFLTHNAARQSIFNFSQTKELAASVGRVQTLSRRGYIYQFSNNTAHPVVTFSLATNSNYKYASGEVVSKTEWHRICVFKPVLRDSVFKYATKGQRVLIQGRLIYGEVKDPQGNPRSTTSVVADDLIYFRSN